MKQQEQSIRKKFKNHIAEFTELSKTMWVLNWREPNTNNFAVQYIFSNGSLMINGDLGEAVYVWHNYIHLFGFADFKQCYFQTKLTAYHEQRHVFDQHSAIKELKGIRREYMAIRGDYDLSREDIYNLFEELEGFVWDVDSTDSFMTLAATTDIIKFDEWWCSFQSLGKKMPYRREAYLVGLHMAIDQINKQSVGVSKSN